MDKQAVKDLVYGGLQELVRNRTYYYNSGIGSNYSHFTEEGEQALKEYMKLMVPKMCEAEEKYLDKRAKELVIKGLKGEKI